MPLDNLDRSKIVELAVMGYSGRAIAQRFNITPQYVSLVLQQEADALAEARKTPGKIRLDKAPRAKQEARSKPARTKSAPPAPQRKVAARRTTA